MVPTPRRSPRSPRGPFASLVFSRDGLPRSFDGRALPERARATSRRRCADAAAAAAPREAGRLAPNDGRGDTRRTLYGPRTRRVGGRGTAAAGAVRARAAAVLRTRRRADVAHEARVDKRGHLVSCGPASGLRVFGASRGVRALRVDAPWRGNCLRFRGEGAEGHNFPPASVEKEVRIVFEPSPPSRVQECGALTTLSTPGKKAWWSWSSRFGTLT